ncbi:MAG: chemotaxis protein CheW [Candidatus Gastranaerophilaceae bacterium]|jgi:purine-binding chemotaxis protein CheW
MYKELLESGQTEIQIIIFKLGIEEYAVPITCVQEIIMRQKATRIPKSPSYVEGVINLRGQIIPVIDGKKKFNLIASEKANSIDERIMVIESEDQTVGMIVDEVSEVIHLAVTDIEPPPVETSDKTDYIWGVGKYEERLFILVDSEKFLDFNQIFDTTKVKNDVESVKNNKNEQCKG